MSLCQDQRMIVNAPSFPACNSCRAPSPHIIPDYEITPRVRRHDHIIGIVQNIWTTRTTFSIVFASPRGKKEILHPLPIAVRESIQKVVSSLSALLYSKLKNPATIVLNDQLLPRLLGLVRKVQGTATVKNRTVSGRLMIRCSRVEYYVYTVQYTQHLRPAAELRGWQQPKFFNYHWRG